jgi:hypothetical protein
MKKNKEKFFLILFPLKNIKKLKKKQKKIKLKEI